MLLPWQLLDPDGQLSCLVVQDFLIRFVGFSGSLFASNAM